MSFSTKISEAETMTHDRVMDHARSLVPILRERAIEAEEIRRQPKETITDLVQGRLARLLVPRRWGGYAMDFETIVAVTLELAKADPSVGWCIGSQSLHSWMLSFFPEEAQQEVWGQNPDAFLATSYSPGHVSSVKGGYRLNGTWSWASGIDESSWIIVLAPLPATNGVSTIRFCLVPRSDITILDDWHVTGMRGTGSKSVQFRDCFVPDYHTVSDVDLREGRANTQEIHFHTPFFVLAPLVYLATLLGTTWGAYEHWTKQTRDISTTGRQNIAGYQHVQIRVGEIFTRLNAVTDLTYGLIPQIVAGSAFESTQRLRLASSHALIANLCLSTLEQILQSSGASALRADHPLQRYWRDGHAIALHQSLNTDSIFERMGCVELGQPIRPGLFV